MPPPEDTAKRPTRAGASPPPHPDELNLAERVLAQAGAWAAVVAARLNPPCGPFFPSDGRLHADTSLFVTTHEFAEAHDHSGDS